VHALIKNNEAATIVAQAILPMLFIGVSPLGGMHLCFRAPNRASVRQFHGAALGAGGHDDGGPGVRPQYHSDYYAAFVVDPDGHRIEAVCHAPEKTMIV
jgi:catechol 2,3-dioxygenase-like lactoylglutathione lyase family enzyme